MPSMRWDSGGTERKEQGSSDAAKASSPILPLMPDHQGSSSASIHVQDQTNRADTSVSTRPWNAHSAFDNLDQKLSNHASLSLSDRAMGLHDNSKVAEAASASAEKNEANVAAQEAATEAVPSSSEHGSSYAMFDMDAEPTGVLPPHWHQGVDHHGRTYYWNRRIGVSQWARPTTVSGPGSTFHATADRRSSSSSVLGRNVIPRLMEARERGLPARLRPSPENVVLARVPDNDVTAAATDVGGASDGTNHVPRRHVEERESMAAGGVAGSSLDSASERLAALVESQRVHSRIMMEEVLLSRLHRARGPESESLEETGPAPVDDATVKQLLLRVHDYQMASLSWNLARQLAALGYHLGDVLHLVACVLWRHGLNVYGVAVLALS